jgi:serine/threonine protein kinase
VRIGRLHTPNNQALTARLSLSSSLPPPLFCAQFEERPPESLIAHYIEECLQGLAYLHEQGVVHRDIKGGNILTNSEGHVKLTDFGLSRKIRATKNRARLKQTASADESDESDGDHKGHDNPSEPQGTAYWMAPELLESAIASASGATSAAREHSTACDIWALGITVIELITGKPPYFEFPPLAAFNQV